METSRSIYRRGAEDGLILGPVMIAAIVLVGLQSYYPWLFFAVMAVVLAVPAVVFMLLRRSFRADGCAATFSALWLEGVCAFAFGSLLMGAATYILLHWCFPDYIADQLRMLADTLAATSDPAAIEWSNTVEANIEAGNIPASTDIVMELIYLAIFTGSMLSIALALIVRKVYRRPRQ